VRKNPLHKKFEKKGDILKELKELDLEGNLIGDKGAAKLL
jgi:hypothetical protein